MIRTQMGTHSRSENIRTCLGRFVRCYTITVTTNADFNTFRVLCLCGLLVPASFVEHNMKSVV
jgi:hypothetical protein